jgi:5-formyltetrahydrofolate cyclo-ligase
MTDLARIKAEARKAAFARRAMAHAARSGAPAGNLSQVLAGYRGVPMSGYMPMRTEIDPLPAMEAAAAHGLVCVPVIVGKGQPLVFSRWMPGGAMKDGPFGARVPETDEFITPQILIVPLVAYDRSGGRLGYGGGFYDRTLQGLRARGPVLAIGYAFATQEAADLPLELTDEPLDMIVTEAEIIEFALR